jgi:hypothetical protein
VGRAFYRKNDPYAPAVRSGKQLARSYLRRSSSKKFGAGQRALIHRAFDEFFEATSFGAALELCDPYDLFYWEHRMGAWHSQVVLESDVAFQSLSLFNSRAILGAMMSAPLEARVSSQNMRALIQEACPECLHEPLNPLPRRPLWRKVRNRGKRLAEMVMRFRRTE